MAAINTKLSEARNERARLQLEWDQARTTKGFGLAQILDSKAIQENRKLRTELVAEYQQKLAQFKPAFPAMLQLKAQIEELDAQAQGEIAAIKGSIKSKFLAAKEEENCCLNASTPQRPKLSPSEIAAFNIISCSAKWIRTARFMMACCSATRKSVFRAR